MDAPTDRTRQANEERITNENSRALKIKPIKLRK